MAEMTFENSGRYHYCPICGKKFFISFPEEWRYRRYVKGRKGVRDYLCSWHCLRIYDDSHPDKRKMRKKRVTESA
jgi:rubredoxin